MLEITPYGAAGEVTGSAYLVHHTGNSTVLVDFGLFQGDKEDDAKNIVPGAIHRGRLDAVLLTHAHLDHCGRLPLLIRDGYRGPIFSTEATRDLVELILRDAAHIQESDFERRKRKAERTGRKIARTEHPLFDMDDVEKTIQRFRLVEYNTPTEVAEGFTAVWVEAGHMLGSASIVLEVRNTTGEDGYRVLFSGDIGQTDLPFLRDPEPPAGPFDIIVMESTYGDRDHKSLADTRSEFATVVAEAINQNGKILIPSFAIGRAQNILYHLAELIRSGRIPQIPIYLDSPMAIEASRLYAAHTDLFDAESTELVDKGALARDLRSVHFVESAQDSKAINDKHGPFIVIAGSGMCNAGRIMHHLRHNIGDPNTHVIITGYQAYGTLGRKLVEGVENVSIMGDYIPVRAQIHTLGGFSAHAGQSQLMNWLRSVLSSSGDSMTHVLLTHGEDSAREVLAELILDTLEVDVVLPTLGITLELP